MQPGDTVFCSSLTFVASCNPILYCGARPVFIDCEPGPGTCRRPRWSARSSGRSREGRLPRCVIVVNLYGQSADMDALLPLCERYGVPILEDAAESLGATYKGRASGSFGQDRRLFVQRQQDHHHLGRRHAGGRRRGRGAAGAQALDAGARERAPHYEHVEIGFNYRMSNVLAGIGRGQLRVLDQRVSQRRQIFETYREALSDRRE